MSKPRRTRRERVVDAVAGSMSLYALFLAIQRPWEPTWWIPVAFASLMLAVWVVASVVDEWPSNRTKQEPRVEPDADTRTAARQLYAMRTAYVQAGFTEGEAQRMTQIALATMAQNAGGVS